MSCNITKKGDKVIVTPPPELDDIESADELKEVITDLFAKGEHQIVINLSDVRTMNSRALGKMLMLYKRVKEGGGELYITPLSGKVKELFELLMLDKLFKIYEL